MKLHDLFEDHPDDIIPPNAYGYALGQAIGKTVAEFRTPYLRKEIDEVGLLVGDEHPSVVFHGMSDIGIPAAFKQRLKQVGISPLYELIYADSTNTHGQETRAYRFKMDLRIKLDTDDIIKGYLTEYKDDSLLYFA